jgi:hypothetical protein
MSASDIYNFFDRVREGELIVDDRHPNYRALESALERFRHQEEISVAASPDVIRDTLNAISMATMRGVIKVRGAESLLSSEPGQPEEPFVREVRRLIVTPPRESTTSPTINIQGDVGEINIIYNNAIQDINSKNIPEERKSKLRQIVDVVRNEYPRILPFVLDALRRIPFG